MCSWAACRLAAGWLDAWVIGYEGRWWGRAIFRVDEADLQYRLLIDAGLSPDEPQDAPWGERYFHISDPDGHELSFAERLPRS